MRSDHLSKHIKTHQKGSRLISATSSTNDALSDAIMAVEADQSDLAAGDDAAGGNLTLEEEDSEDESGSDISDSEIASSQQGGFKLEAAL